MIAGRFGEIYNITEFLGGGGYGRIYKAVKKSTSEVSLDTVAQKIFKKFDTDDSKLDFHLFINLTFEIENKSNDYIYIHIYI